MRAIWVVVLLAALNCTIMGGAVARWESDRDNRSRAELEQFDDRKLFEEAFDVCVRRAALLGGNRATPGTERLITAADDYLAVIEMVARAKKGVVPGWLRDLSFARTTKECQAVFRAFVSGEAAPETLPAKGTPVVAEPTPTSIAPRKGTSGITHRSPPKVTPTRTPIIRVPAFPLVWHTPTPVRTATTPARGTPMPSRESTEVRRSPHPADVQRWKSAKGTPVTTPTPARDEVTEELPPWFR